MLSTVFVWIIYFVEILLGFVSAYVVFLTVCAFLPRRGRKTNENPTTRFAVLIPAHDEERLLCRLLVSLHKLDYPSELFTTYVVADNCSDQTATVAREGGAEVYERNELSLIGKGHALNWLLERVCSGRRPYDAFVIVDADSVLSANFLRVMDRFMSSGSSAVQAYYTVINPTDSWMASLRYVALASVHYLRPKGKSVIRASAGLKGNGMCFSAPLVAELGWNAFGLAEDVEYHLNLIARGVRVEFASEAVVEAEMPHSLRQAESQNLRWERGRLQMVRQHAPHLLLSGLKSHNIAQIDAALEQFIPPFSMPIVMSFLCLIGGLVVGSSVATFVAVGLIATQVFYVLSGLIMVKAPLKVCLALACAPVYIVWKFWLYLAAAVSMGDERWVRTSRT